LAQTSTPKQDAALFAEMLSLPNDGRCPALELTPQQRRQETLEALVSQVELLAWQNPVLVIFEDTHWSDPTSLEVLGRIVDRVRSLPVLLLVTFRPEFDPPWLGRAYFVQKMKTKWGSCNAESKSIRLNTELTKKPTECLEYVIVHEMAHLLVRHHDDRFTSLMDRHLPNWKLVRQTLNQGHLLIQTGHFEC
jgi:hypothetical protein